MSGFFRGFDDEAASWNVPNPVEWMTSKDSSSFSTLSSKQREASLRMTVDQEASSTPQQQQSRQDDVVQDVGMVVPRDAEQRNDDDDSLQEERDIFDKAREYLRPTRFFRLVIQLYAQRKMSVFFLVHFAATMVIWCHFALIKFEQQAEAVPVGANRYWLKRLAPPLEFGKSCECC